MQAQIATICVGTIKSYLIQILIAYQKFIVASLPLPHPFNYAENIYLEHTL